MISWPVNPRFIRHVLTSMSSSKRNWPYLSMVQLIFFFRVYPKRVKDMKIPFMLEGITRIDDTPVHKTLLEASANWQTEKQALKRRLKM